MMFRDIGLVGIFIFVIRESERGVVYVCIQ